MTRSKKNGNDQENDKDSNSTKSSKKIVVKTKTNKQWVFICKETVFSADSNYDDSHPLICKLQHPRFGYGVLHLVSADFKTIHELNCFDEKYHSWFLDNDVHSGNKIHFATPIDPLFLLLPCLINSGKNGRFTPLDQMAGDNESPDLVRLLSAVSPGQLRHVCDFKDIDDDLQVYRFSKKNCMNWLKAKTDAAAEVLKLKDINVDTKGSKSSMFVRSKESVQANEETYKQYACEMICEYLPVGIEEELRSYLGIPAVEEKKQKEVENQPPKKKIKLDSDLTPTDDYSAGVDLKKDKSKNSKLTPAQKKLQQTDKTGMKSISSFFSPKNNKIK